MPNVASHTELYTPIAVDGNGYARINKQQDRWQYALPGHTLATPRTLTISRIGADNSLSTKKGWKFVISVVETDAAGEAMAPSVGVCEVRALPETSDTTVDAIYHALNYLCMTAIEASNTDNAYAPGTLDYDQVFKGFELPEGRFMPRTTIV